MLQRPRARHHSVAEIIAGGERAYFNEVREDVLDQLNVPSQAVFSDNLEQVFCCLGVGVVYTLVERSVTVEICHKFKRDVLLLNILNQLLQLAQVAALDEEVGQCLPIGKDYQKQFLDFFRVDVVQVNLVVADLFNQPPSRVAVRLYEPKIVHAVRCHRAAKRISCLDKILKLSESDCVQES